MDRLRAGVSQANEGLFFAPPRGLVLGRRRRCSSPTHGGGEGFGVGIGRRAEIGTGGAAGAGGEGGAVAQRPGIGRGLPVEVGASGLQRLGAVPIDPRRADVGGRGRNFVEAWIILVGGGLL